MTLVRDRISAFASTHLVDLTGVDGRLFRGEERPRDQRREISQALDFAYGLDPAGRRLPLLSDDLPVEILRRKMVIRERYDAKWASIYAIADRFDDGQPNVKVIADSRWTAAGEPKTSAGDRRGTDLSGANRSETDRNPRGSHAPRTPRPSRVAHGDMNVRHVGRPTSDPTRHSASAQRGPSGRAGSYATGRSVTPSSGQRSIGQRSRDRSTQSMVTSVDRSQEVLTDGATALDVAASPRLRRSEVRRPPLSVVRGRPKFSGQVGVVAFWTIFVVALMFAAVIMWAQNTTRSIQLEQVNEKLETEESTYTQLRVEVARLQSPQRIEAEANRLGLSTPENITFIAPDRSETAPTR